MDALASRRGCWLWVFGLLLFCFTVSSLPAPLRAAEESKSEESSSEEKDASSEDDAAEELGPEKLLSSMLSMASLRSYGYNFVKGILILASFWILGVILFRVIRRVGRARHVDDGLAEFLGRVIKVAALIVGAITALSEMGIDVGALVAGLGLTGFAFGFAFKDIISNVLAGVLIIIYKPFQVGDQIKIKAYAGNVVSIDLRYTVLNTDGDMVYVPNSLLFTDAITVENTVASTEAAPSES